ncbi:hypothetical protein B9Z55_012825 [Caenorhabditis nigoni]|nr:hypothetical protein B9Z55_012825 [Caenorhabditis nigoni]
MTTAVVHVSGYSKPIGLEDHQMCYTAYWGVDHPNSHQAVVEGYLNKVHVELFAARMAIRTAAKQKYSRIIVRCDSRFAYDQIKNSANFARAPEEILHLVASIHDYKKQILVEVEFSEN